VLLVGKKRIVILRKWKIGSACPHLSASHSLGARVSFSRVRRTHATYRPFAASPGTRERGYRILRGSNADDVANASDDLALQTFHEILRQR